MGTFYEPLDCGRYAVVLSCLILNLLANVRMTAVKKVGT